MAKDPAFLFYPGDWLGGTMGMSFEEKGAYLELLLFQFNNGKFDKAQAKQVLSICSASVFEKVLQKFDTDGKFYWKQKLSDEMERRRKFSESRKINAKGKKTTTKSVKAYAQHMETETEIETETLKEYKEWTDLIIDRLDHNFQTLLYNERISVPHEAYDYWISDHLDLLHRYPKMRPTSQQAFRRSALKHLRENYKKTLNNGTTKEHPAQAAARNFAERHGVKSA